ncbi:hypothetical protein [Alkaliphilus serpentinus]|uniref:Uncharacterized protein n=1 Tax=Alkaliphilus serpentinus TaxID=1482731 RepID=A0A833HLA4_9FIRM|nr:hypothetical protein [Alkaliphilus serpentinus]KAB3525459.1 hypothetical protein F8153_15350 [Alkaliphilus serpentinus]
MSDNLTDFIYRVSTALMFIVAISSQLFFYNGTSKTISFIEESYSSGRTIYEGSPLQEDYSVMGSEIISQITLGLEKPIEVDGVSINTDVDIYNFNFSIINPTGNYDVTNIIDGNGIIMKVVYRQR